MIELHDQHPLIRTWNEGVTYHLDVRPLLEQGGEPYVYILDCVNQLAAGERLMVHALFEPKPLIAQMRHMGFRADAQRIDAEHWAIAITAAG